MAGCVGGWVGGWVGGRWMGRLSAVDGCHGVCVCVSACICVWVDCSSCDAGSRQAGDVAGDAQSLVVDLLSTAGMKVQGYASMHHTRQWAPYCRLGRL